MCLQDGSLPYLAAFILVQNKLILLFIFTYVYCVVPSNHFACKFNITLGLKKNKQKKNIQFPLTDLLKTFYLG